MEWEKVVQEIEDHGTTTLFCITGSIITTLTSLQEKLMKSDFIHENTRILLLSSRAQYIRRHQYEGLFFQQRYQASYKDEGETVRQRMNRARKGRSETEFMKGIKEFELESLYDKPLLQLSSGEWQRFSVYEALLSRPDILIIPDLLKGLDRSWQNKILELIHRSLKAKGLLIFTSMDPIKNLDVHHILLDHEKSTNPRLTVLDAELIDQIHQYQSTFLTDRTGRVQLEMTGVNIQYGNRKILDNIHWTVRAGEKWNIQGPNGAGKSTLISLINSDNPQGYSQPIRLFGSKYGQHSMWARKARISYFGSDFFQYFHSTKTIEKTLSQLLKTPYLNTIQPPAALIEKLLEWFGLSPYKHHPFSTADKETRRQVLLLATYLKSSDILILDEPYQDFSVQKIRQNNVFLDSIQSKSFQTVLFVTHQETHKPPFLDHVLKLEQGQIAKRFGPGFEI